MSDIDVSIVIPTKNGGALFEEVLAAVFAQKTKYSYEVICVDSGSSDNTLDIIKKYDAKLYQIKPEEFGHGKTRNYGASKGSGEFIVFITQDAKPYNDSWLDNFIDAMKTDNEIAGGFGKHYPYPECNLPDKRMLRNHFANFGENNFVFKLEDDKRDLYFNDEGYRQYLAFFSDNNSCLRRSVWEKIPYDDVNFAEDQFWARKILEAGYKKVYCPFAGVYHSHNYKLSSYYGRYYDEFKAVYQVYGSKACNGVKEYWRGVLGTTWGDIKFIKHEPVSKKEKIYWAFYSLRRNFYRYNAGLKAVKYFSMSEEKKRAMDRKYSQQYKMIKK
ncbi:MAG: glycosyltransferase family 2 protein [Erysipelotrichaceae bacterium]|nr:glycosyltransferase family 2 protein [Erysipelotrichaceae bacterium]